MWKSGETIPTSTILHIKPVLWLTVARQTHPGASAGLRAVRLCVCGRSLLERTDAVSPAAAARACHVEVQKTTHFSHKASTTLAAPVHNSDQTSHKPATLACRAPLLPPLAAFSSWLFLAMRDFGSSFAGSAGLPDLALSDGTFFFFTSCEELCFGRHCSLLLNTSRLQADALGLAYRQSLTLSSRCVKTTSQRSEVTSVVASRWLERKPRIHQSYSFVCANCCPALT